MIFASFSRPIANPSKSLSHYVWLLIKFLILLLKWLLDFDGIVFFLNFGVKAFFFSDLRYLHDLTTKLVGPGPCVCHLRWTVGSRDPFGERGGGLADCFVSKAQGAELSSQNYNYRLCCAHQSWTWQGPSRRRWDLSLHCFVSNILALAPEDSSWRDIGTSRRRV